MKAGSTACTWAGVNPSSPWINNASSPLVISASESPCQRITPSSRAPRTNTCDTHPFTLMSSVCSSAGMGASFLANQSTYS